VPYDQVELGRRVRQAIEAGGRGAISRVARQVGMTESNLQRLMGGKVAPRADSLYRIAEATGRPADWLLGRSGESRQAAPAGSAAPLPPWAASLARHVPELPEEDLRTVIGLARDLHRRARERKALRTPSEEGSPRMSRTEGRRRAKG